MQRFWQMDYVLQSGLQNGLRLDIKAVIQRFLVIIQAKRKSYMHSISPLYIKSSNNHFEHNFKFQIRNERLTQFIFCMFISVKGILFQHSHSGCHYNANFHT